jgi:endonuclease/exonuclease/phosphatase family metal-dependent hydrolase
MPLKLLTLNVEQDRHRDRVRAALATHLPDIVCLQEVLDPECSVLAEISGYEFQYAPMTRVRSWRRGRMQDLTWGIAMLTRIPLKNRKIIYYSDEPELRDFQQPSDARQVLIATEFDHEGQPHRLMTTHFTWSPGGQFTEEQHTDFKRLKAELIRYPDYVLCGDFNAPRGGPLFSLFTDELNLIDHLPAHITTTLDAQFHRAGALELVVDTIFSTHDYAVKDVHVLEGISDHKGIIGTLRRSC